MLKMVTMHALTKVIMAFERETGVQIRFGESLNWLSLIERVEDEKYAYQLHNYHKRFIVIESKMSVDDIAAMLKKK